MKLAYKILLFVFVFALKSNAQIYFNKLYDYDNTNSFNNTASSSVEFSNGDFLFSATKFYSTSFSALHFIRINSTGDTLLSKRYPKQNCAYYTGPSGSLVKCIDGNFVQAGSYYDSTLTNSDALLVKLNEYGDTLWTRTYGGINFDIINAVCQTPDSGFILMGSTQSFSMGSAADFYLIKTDSLGNFLWQQVYGTTLAEDCISGHITLDGGFIMCGIKNSLLYALKTDSSGNFEWDRQVPGTAGTGFIKQLSDSTYILVGAKFVAGLSYQAYMAKLSKTGGVVWEKTFGASGDQQFYAVPIILNDGSIVCSGISTIGTTPWGLLIKTDSLGNQQWLRTYYANPSNDNYVYDVKLTSDEGFIMTGSGNITSQDAWVLKLDSAGCEIANCNVGMEEFQVQNSVLHVYPNPSSSEINISIEGEYINEYEISIVNILGESQKTEINQSVISVSELTSGIYFITATSKAGQKRLSQKFVKE